ncbi:hypothetical protein AVEN_120273-1 [Araneus ventricosus]|uniref:HTH CENPB-type domain-containing protein n=1 Tax=Araneus ventricosus TaxID=182803 RepID=A0A4Y2SNR3_ARAVE|nr:hypothetical protein AVEN_85065-1 [Araneus ventricosus]GBN89959.1 hypothetical protein AVEN_120273-1 [Araneus ventricosus]
MSVILTNSLRKPISCRVYVTGSTNLTTRVKSVCKKRLWGVVARKKYVNCQFELQKWKVVPWRRKKDCNLPIGGNELKEKAEQFAQELGYKDFKSSNGWLKIFKNRHNIVFRKLCAESQSVSDELYSEWIKTLPGLLQEYAVLMRLGFSSKHC